MGSEVPANIPGAKVLQKPFDPDDLLAAINAIPIARE
jgi:DNA-binding response OmpR family regulator